jgi:hypothetical protein
MVRPTLIERLGDDPALMVEPTCDGRSATPHVGLIRGLDQLLD